MALDAATLITRIRSRVNITDTTLLPPDDVLEAINAAQERMVQGGSEWRNLDQSYSFTYGIGDDGVPLPTGLAKLDALLQVDAAQADPSLRLVPCGQVDRQQWLERASQPDGSATFPVEALSNTYFYIWHEKIYIVPQPTETLSFVLDYYGAPEDLTASGPGSVNYFTRRYFRTLMWGALVHVWDFLAEDERMLQADAQFAVHYDRAKAAETAYRSSGPQRSRGA